MNSTEPLSENEQRVLELLHQANRPLRAYDLVRSFRPGKNTGAPTVYRALGKLAEKGVIHRVESLNAYVPCRSSKDDCAAALVVCDSCQIVHEVDGPRIDGLLAESERNPNFVTSRVYLEFHGICDLCHEDHESGVPDDIP